MSTAVAGLITAMFAVSPFLIKQVPVAQPFLIAKGPGAAVLSGAINGDAALIVRATRVAADSRYARIMRVMQEAEQRRPALRRLGDQLGAKARILSPLAGDDRRQRHSPCTAALMASMKCPPAPFQRGEA